MGACAKTMGNDAMASAAVPGSQQDFVVNVGDRVFFDSDQTDLTPQAIATLEKQVQWLQAYPRYTFTIEGHADERGTREYNIALGARRAQSVRTFMTSRGIDASRMRTISYGKERPVAVCNDISCWSQNRRAVTVLNASS
jgi:peptidoglycan-associated lipoprotein